MENVIIVYSKGNYSTTTSLLLHEQPFSTHIENQKFISHMEIQIIN